MKTRKLTKVEYMEAIEKIMHFKTPAIRDLCIEILSSGRSVVVDALNYRGNGKYESVNGIRKYRYKMIVPIVTNTLIFYSTDLYEKSPENAVKGEYSLYYSTRQLVVGIVDSVKADYSEERLGFGYKDGKYGVYKAVLNK